MHLCEYTYNCLVDAFVSLFTHFQWNWTGKWNRSRSNNQKHFEHTHKSMEHATDFYQRIENQKPTYIWYVAVGLHVTECGCVWFTYEIAMPVSIHKSMALWCGWDNWPFQWLLSCHMECTFPYCFTYSETLMWFTRLKQRSFHICESHAQCVCRCRSRRRSCHRYCRIIHQYG